MKYQGNFRGVQSQSMAFYDVSEGFRKILGGFTDSDELHTVLREFGRCFNAFQKVLEGFSGALDELHGGSRGVSEYFRRLLWGLGFLISA